MGIMKIKGRGVIYGQNFLTSEAIARDIVDSCRFSAYDDVVEIGPGEGILTKLTAGNTRTLTIIEIDPFYYNLIKEKFNKTGRNKNDIVGYSAETGGAPKISVLNEDALKFDYLALSERLSSKIRLISNLPYEISSPIMEKFTKEKAAFSDLTLMFQKEFAERLCAMENDSARGALSVVAGLNFEIVKILDVGKTNFNPPPKVDSTVLKLAPRYHADEDYAWAAGSQFFSYFTHQIFKLRRKKLKNSIYASFFGIPPDVKEKIFSGLSMDLNKRPQELTTDELVKAGRQYDDYLKAAESRYGGEQ